MDFIILYWILLAFILLLEFKSVIKRPKTMKFFKRKSVRYKLSHWMHVSAGSFILFLVKILKFIVSFSCHFKCYHENTHTKNRSHGERT